MHESKPFILIVDDDKDFADSLFDLLKSRSIDGRVAYSAEQALELIKENDFDVALLDIRLGAISGIELIHLLRDINPELVCIIMTAYAAVDTAIEALQKEAYDYLRKPMNVADLFSTINRGYEMLLLNKEKEEAQLSLKKSEKKYRTLIETMKESVVVIDDTGNINYVNEHFCILVNEETNEILGHPLTDFLDSSNQKIFIEHSNSSNKEETKSFEMTFLRRERADTPTIISIVNLTDDDGKFNGKFAVITDINKQKIAEEYMRVQRDLSLILSGSTDMKASMKLILDAVLRISGMDNGSVFLSNNETGGMDLVHHEGVSSDFAQFHSSIEPDMWLLQIMKNRKPIYVTHKDIGYPVDEVLRKEALQCFMTIPIICDDKIIALINLGSHTLKEIPEDVKPVIESIAFQIGEVLSRINIEETLAKERSTLDNIISLNPYGIIVFDSDGKFIRTNKAFQKLFGGLPPSDYSLLEDTLIKEKGFLKNVNKIMMGEIIKEDNIHINLMDIYGHSEKKEINFSFTAFPIFSTNGELENIIIMLEDITERIKIQEALRESEEKFKAIVKSAKDIIFIKDDSFIYTFVNPQMEKLFNCESQDLVGKSDFDLFPKDNAEGNRKADKKVLQGEICEVEHNLVINDVEYCFHVVKVPMRDANNNIVGLCGISRNITEMKQTEEQLLEYQKQLQSLASQLSISEDQERRRIATELHDRISQSLAFSKIQLGLLGEDATGTEFVDKIEKIRDLINDTIQDTRTLTFELCPPVLYELGLQAALEWLVEDFQKRHELNISIDCGKSDKTIGDNIKGILFRSVRELLVNIVKHANATEVQIVTEIHGNNLEIEVTDNGTGFGNEELTYKYDDDSGFGLFSIRERMNHFGGQLEIDTDYKNGARLKIIAPFNIQQ